MSTCTAPTAKQSSGLSRIEAAQNTGMSERRLKTAQALVEGHVDEIRRAWHEHFGT
ncbi:MAG TPA: hypothetical protein VHW73_01420 [Rudaea sp.]|jgi:CRISPR/Cas system-associated endonuclease Cas1|nr:hypothetical protein [Rudaea sp.]